MCRHPWADHDKQITPHTHRRGTQERDHPGGYAPSQCLTYAPSGSVVYLDWRPGTQKPAWLLSWPRHGSGADYPG
jgi:hypothetical protein